MDEIPSLSRPVGARHGGEREQLESWMTFYRATLLNKCAGLTLEELTRRPVPTSTMSMLGLLRHMTFVEQIWFDARFAGHDVVEYYRSAEDRDAEWNELDSAPLDEVVANFQLACATSDRLARSHELDEMAKESGHNRERADLRWIYLHMIEEYARHCGHADLMREMIDGSTGY